MAASDHLSEQQFTLWRGEGSHDRKSHDGDKIGGFYTEHRDVAQQYAGKHGHLYRLDAKPGETERGRGYSSHEHYVEDDSVRARRVHASDCPTCTLPEHER